LSLSFPFLMPSEQVGAAHTPLAQFCDVQSPLTLQAAAGAHAKQLPPQSTSVSSPSLMPSLQDGAAHWPLRQTRPLPQSSEVPHLPMARHLVAHEPPQSMSVSVPFWTLSVQVGAIVQSLPLPHSVDTDPQTENTNPATLATSTGNSRVSELRIRSPPLRILKRGISQNTAL
jgi:hypothetical protein